MTGATRSTGRRDNGGVTHVPRPRSEAMMDDGLDDVVAAARRGDQEAFSALVRGTYDAMYTLAYRLTGNEEDARDVVQEAYLRAYRGMGQFRGEARVGTWLYRITANCAATHIGRRRRH